VPYHGADIALKIIKSTTSSAMLEFQHEIGIHKHLRPHPNVVSVLGVCMDLVDPFILSEYIDGGSLSQLLNETQAFLSPEAAVQICKDVASGISHVHREGILHNDIASRNVLVSAKTNGSYTAKVKIYMEWLWETQRKLEGEQGSN